MPVTVGDLAEISRFAIRLLVTPPDGLPTAPVAWVHSSDLADPTPFLEPGHVLLTDGAQFGTEDGGFAADYVARLVGRGILALGFATRVVHDRVPAPLIEACARQGLALLEVGERTPFIAIIRWVADAIARERTERLEWSIAAQRAIARAALRPDALRGILGEVERQLRCWVAVFDARGEQLRIPGVARIPEPVAESVAATVRDALARGRRSAETVEVAGDRIVLQTLGRGGDLGGAVVLGGIEAHGAPDGDVVTSVIALATLALEQSRALDVARGQVRSGVLELLLSAELDAAATIARPLWGRLPRGPVRVVTARTGRQPSALRDAVESLAHARRSVFFAIRGEVLVVLAPDDDVPAVRDALAGSGRSAGISAPTTLDRLAAALEQAERCRRQAEQAGAPAVVFDDLAAGGILGVLRDADAAPLARRLVGVLAEYDERERTELLPTVRAWFEENCAWIPTARRLGIHRHSLRNRVDTAGRILNLDLDLVRDRLELWAALELAP